MVTDALRLCCCANKPGVKLEHIIANPFTAASENQIKPVNAAVRCETRPDSHVVDAWDSPPAEGAAWSQEEVLEEVAWQFVNGTSLTGWQEAKLPITFETQEALDQGLDDIEDVEGFLTPTVGSLGRIPQHLLGSTLGEIGLLWRCHRATEWTLESDYVMTSKELGSCCNGKVRLATSKHGKRQPAAVKTYRLKGLSTRKRVRLRSEIEIFLCMDHPHVARLLNVYESEAQINLVMEYVEGGQLFDRLVRVNSFSEPEAANASNQILLALHYLHSKGVAHRDLKLENFLYDCQGGSHLKMIDFGLSEYLGDTGIIRGTCGTLSYVAPEVLNGCCTAKCDLWSLGVIVFALLSGSMPFRGAAKQQRAQIKLAGYDFREDCWRRRSNSAKEFILLLMEIDPALRLTAKAALDHEWIAMHCKTTPIIDSGFIDALNSWICAPTAQRVCLSIMVWSLTNEQHSLIRNLFLALDSDRNGTISLYELQQVLSASGQRLGDEAHNVFSALHDADICYTDFLAAMIPNHIHFDASLVCAAFSRFDNSCGESSYRFRKLLSGAFAEPSVAESRIYRNSGIEVDYEELANNVQKFKEIGEANSSKLEKYFPTHSQTA